MGDPIEIDGPIFDEDEPDEPETYGGVDPDGKERHPLFAGRYAAPDMSMVAAGARPDPNAKPRKHPNGAIARSPFA